MSDGHHIAIVGMAGRFPGAGDLDEFWANLSAGRESVTEASEEELRAAGVPDSALADSRYVRAVASAPHVADLDAAFFGFTPREAASSDPQIRMFLETAHAALEHSGHDPHRSRETVAVYGSAGTNRYVDLHLGNRGDASSTSSMAVSSLNYTDYVASTVAYKLDLRGAAITLSTACSSSLVALHLACQALRNGECDLALAGGVDVEYPVGHGYQWDDGGPVSRSGHVRPFDADADGTVFGTGAGVVVVKRLSDAVADGDTIHAVIRGTAVNNDGADKAGFTAPAVTGQAAMLTEALAMAGVNPTEISYVEAHATGTLLGDPIEIAALTKAYRRLAGTELPPGSCAIGSVKGNVGHLGHAAGAASLIKVVLALRHGLIPPSANFTRANERLQLDRTPFYVAGSPLPWPRRAEAPRIAGVSSFGIGGTNAHVVLAEPPPPAPAEPSRRLQLLVWSAKSAAAVDAYRDRLAAHLEADPGAPFDAVAATLQEGRRAYPVRRAVVAATAAEAVVALRGGEVLGPAGAGPRREVVFLFPGQGAQQARMAAGLYGAEPVFTDALDRCLEAFDGPGRLRESWLSATDEELADTALAQPLLFSVEYALAQLWASWGVRPTAVCGHSVGEIAAAAVAGVLDLPDAVDLVAARVRATVAAPPGGMLAVAAGVETLAGGLPDEVAVAVVNGPAQTVLAGPGPALDEVAARLAAERVGCRRLATSRAFHSPLMAGAAAAFAAEIADARLARPTLPLYSAAAGGAVDAEATDPSFWADQLAAPVRFDRALDALLGDGGRVAVEVGPGQTLRQLARHHPEVASGRSVAVPTLPRRAGGDDARHALGALARVWTEGCDADWPAVRQHRPLRRVPLPGYPYQRARHWADVPAPAADTPASVPPGPPPTPVPAASPFSVLTWVEQPFPAAVPAAPVDALVLLPAEPEAGLPVLLALQQAGLRPVVARAADGYREVGREFRVRPAVGADLDRALDALAARGVRPGLLVHALTVAPLPPPAARTVDEQVDVAYSSLVELVRAGGRRPADGAQPAVLAVTSGSVDVTGAEPVEPVKALLHGFLRSLVREAPRLHCRLIDAAPGTGEAELAAELGRWDAHEVVALRGRRRWVRREQPWEPTDPGAPAIRRRGVYLVTGGLGGLGLEVARWLAGTGLRPRLVLLGRTGLPAEQADPGADDARTARLRPRIAELETLGAEVRVVECDIADRRAVRRALDSVGAHFGPVDGVLHLAGIAGDGMVHFRDPADSARVLAPKVHGTLALAEALGAQSPVDFVVLFSSRAAVDGLVGSADYAAANAFCDAYAAVLDRSGTPALSIDWPSWSAVGMAARPGGTAGRPVAAAGTRSWRTELDPALDPVLDEHRVDGRPVLPGTGHLDLVVRAFRAEVAEAAGAVRLGDVVFHRVLVAPTRRAVEVRLTPAGTGWRFEVWSSPADPDDSAAEPVRHASGRIRAEDAPPRTVDVSGWRRRCPRPLDESAEPPRLFSLGPRWDNVTRVAVGTDPATPERLLDLALPEPYAAEVRGHALHPTLLDSATASVREAADGPHLPFLYEDLLVRAALPARMVALVRRRPAAPGLVVADVELATPDGEVVAEVSGFTMRRVDGTGFLTEPDPDPAAEPGAVSSRPDDQALEDGEGIPPDEGVRLLGVLLRSRHPGQVAVRPYVDGRPVPLPAAAAVPTVPPAVAGPAPALAPLAVPAGPAPTPVPAPPAATRADPGDLESRLAELWTEAIGQPGISADDDFFELGGNSLTAVGLMGAVRERFGVDLSIAALFDYPTIGKLANALREQGIG